MKKIVIFSTIFLSVILSFAFFGCANPGEEELGIKEKPIYVPPPPIKYNLIGKVQTGPPQSGAEVQVQELNDNLDPTGAVYIVFTEGDFGAFTVADIDSRYVEITSSGVIYDATKGIVTTQSVLSWAVADLQSESIVNVNPLTMLSSGYIKAKFRAGYTFTNAQKESETLVLAAFNIDEDVGTFPSMDIQKAESSDSILISVSSILLFENDPDQFAALVSRFNLDFAGDGVINSETLIAELREAAIYTDSEAVKTNLKAYYLAAGATITVPDFENYLYKLDTTPPEFVSIYPFDASSDVALDVSISIQFDKPIDPSMVTVNIDTGCGGSVQISIDNFASCVPLIGEFTTEDRGRKLVVKTASNMVSGTLYSVQVSTTAQTGIRSPAGHIITPADPLLGKFTTEN